MWFGILEGGDSDYELKSANTHCDGWEWVGNLCDGGFGPRMVVEHRHTCCGEQAMKAPGLTWPCCGSTCRMFKFWEEGKCWG